MSRTGGRNSALACHTRLGNACGAWPRASAPTLGEISNAYGVVANRRALARSRCWRLAEMRSGVAASSAFWASGIRLPGRSAMWSPSGEMSGRGLAGSACA